MIIYLLFLFALLLLLVTALVRWLTNKRRRRAYTVGFSMREPVSTQQTEPQMPQKLIDLDNAAEFGDDELSELEEDEELDEA
jgi:hypothetical protein